MASTMSLSMASSSFAGRKVSAKTSAARPAARAMTVVAAAKTTVIGYKDKGFRTKQTGAPKEAPTLLTRVEELRLLTKAEQAGLLSLAEKLGLSLSTIEKYGILSTAEDLGLIAAAGNRSTPVALNAVALALFAVAPAVVYLTPEDSTALVAAQVAAVVICSAGGAAALGASRLLSTLQK